MQVTSESDPSATSRRTAADRFLALRQELWRRLPRRLGRIVPPDFIGYAILNLFTFLVDMAVLTLTFRGLHAPYPVATTIGYGTALVLSYLLNRWLNFHSRAPVGPQTVRYAFVVLVNYFVLLQGVGTGLEHLGVQFQLSRLIAAVCEGLWTYAGMRWIVFRGDTRPVRATATVASAPAALAAGGAPDGTEPDRVSLRN
ncbi:GtrA family protein [Raineyella sp.]|uniref:GtrA/DPMS transmembrane domain-containing protein n=1 Tax=bioreactor metagenome TaxID=1076179 RepID=A0A644X4B5_9ZZZZ|nr:GtrA family protein [Raineyella sp.]MEA5154010.1 GtrA family protein [Raineyella sp.]